MLENIHNENVLFLDIETAPQYASYDQLPEQFKEFWDKKAERIKQAEETSKDIYSKAGIFAEFGKIICISVGYVYYKEQDKRFRIKSFYGDDEQQLLQEFADMLIKFFQKPNTLLCGHNGKEFDFPYIARRMLVNGVALPDVLKVHGKKPWETPFLDTLELWKFGDRKNYTSLSLLTTLFEIPSPKEDIDGSMVGEVYWNQQDLKRIVSYCENDVLAVVQLFQKFKGEDLIPDENVEKVTE